MYVIGDKWPIPVLSISQDKGGVGKTTISKMVAEGLARRNRRVLGIDLDQQCSFSRRLIPMHVLLNDAGEEVFAPDPHVEYEEGDEGFLMGASSIYTLFMYGLALPYKTGIPTLDIIPCDSRRYYDLERRHSNEIDFVINALHRWFIATRIWEDYDAIIIDTPPSKGPIAKSALKSATHLLIPAVMEQMCFEGLVGMLGMYKREKIERTPDRPLDLIGIVPSRFDARISLHETYYKECKESEQIAPFLSSVTVHEWVDYKEYSFPAPGVASIFDKGKRQKAAQEAQALVDLVERAMFGKTTEQQI